MKVYIELEEKDIQTKYSGTVLGLLKKLKINPQTVIVARGSELLTEADTVKNTDNIRILAVISGG
ncbi:MoaD/ThiS family protein [Candidatus Woesearchaeota archaeon]|nr:MoaD/ThiS family protein [Candidatus Woesearchaeota archaeon]